MSNEEMIKEMSLKEFRDSGLLWYINQQLHLFGVALTVEINDNNEPIRLYPARCKFRGFSEEVNTNGYKKVSKYLNQHSEELLKDCDDE